MYEITLNASLKEHIKATVCKKKESGKQSILYPYGTVIENNFTFHKKQRNKQVSNIKLISKCH